MAVALCRSLVSWPTPLGVKRFLRSPVTIVGEVAAIAMAGVLGTIIPQAATSSTEGMSTWRASPGFRRLVSLFSLDHVFQSEWFLLLLAAAAASLSIVFIEQVRRLRRQLAPPAEAQFKAAPYRSHFERPARTEGLPRENRAGAEVRIERRLGVVGSPLFHFGLLLVIVAGVLRSLFGVDAMVDLVEGETLPPTAAAWAAQSPGLLARPFRLDRPVTLEAVRARYYDEGELRDLSVRLSFAERDEVRKSEIAINSEVAAPGGRLFTDANFGPAALLEWQSPGAQATREAVLLKHNGNRAFEGSSTPGGPLRAHLRSGVAVSGNRPAQLDVRVMNGPALLFAGVLRPGEELVLHGGWSVRLHGLPFWARLHGNRDPGLWLLYCGFLLVLAGAILIFGYIRVDTLVLVSSFGNSELVFVAVKPHRFSPLFREQFERLVREQGGSA